MKVNAKNERIKRRFFIWLKEADGCCDSTVNNTETAILVYEDFTKKADFATFNPDRAVRFKKWLSKRQFRGKPISLTTHHSYLRYLRKFFSWLSWQPGYKSRITPDVVDYLKLSEKDKRMATQQMPKEYPSLDYVVKLVDSIQINSEVDLRDRALMAFAALSGMRDMAIVTLPIGCFNEESLAITQDPRKGVRTKFSKFIPSTILRIDDRLVSYVVEWAKHLKSKGFSSRDPLFPRSKTERRGDNLSFEPAKEVEPVFWKKTGRITGIFRDRSRAAGLPYFSPHAFRHLSIDLAIRHCRTGEEMKAISQNFGHEHIATTFSCYANYDLRRLSQILKGMDFSGKPCPSTDEMVKEIWNRVRKNGESPP